MAKLQLSQADLHMHVDFDPEKEKWHGVQPSILAQAIVDSRIDAYALTEHNKVSADFFAVHNEVQRLLDLEEKREGVRRQVHSILGVELTMMNDAYPCHIGLLFEEEFSAPYLPEVLPELRGDAGVLDEYIRDYPAVCIFHHPGWHDYNRFQAEKTRELMNSDLIDGVEIANGTILFNGKKARPGARNCIVNRYVATAKSFLDARLQNRHLAPVGSSDAHRPEMVGSAVTGYLGETRADLFAALKAGQTTVILREPAKVIPKMKEVKSRVRGLDRFLKFSPIR